MLIAATAMNLANGLNLKAMQLRSACFFDSRTHELQVTLDNQEK